MPAVAVELRNVTKRFGESIAVDRVSVQVLKGEFFSLLGPSGCGKTTTLRTVAGFLQPDDGLILVDGEDVTAMPPTMRDMGMVYQNYALFPHMTVFENVAFGLEMRRVSRPQIRDRVMQALSHVRLQEYVRRYPKELSGGEQQRVALARAIVIEPRVLLLDEPLSNLDATLRKNMQIELRDLQQRVGITAIYVTHDQEEALTLSDRIMVMNRGTVMQIDSPKDLYERPSNTFVASFIGRSNLLSGRLEAGARFVTDRGLALRAGAGDIGREPSRARVLIRPESVRLIQTEADAETGSANVVLGTISHVVFVGSLTHYYADLPDATTLLVEAQNSQMSPRFRVGDPVRVIVPVQNVYVIPGE
jgi:putative spermidine/putrescine transport system ATP-binding protein